MMRHHHSLALMFLLASFTTANVHRSPSMVVYSTSIDTLDKQLTHSLLEGQIHQPEVYSRAVNILTGLESAPSCHRVATLTLINSCQSLERSTATEVALYETREEYATKLAMCELDGAKATISSHCTDFVPSEKACRKQKSGGFFSRSRQVVDDVQGKVCYPEVTRRHVKSCVTALQSKPQWWTSYSNALQNVVVVCQASRSAIEKDKILEQFKKAAAVGSDVTEALADSYAKSQAFASSLQNLQARVRQEQELEWERTRETNTQFLLKLQNSVYGMIRSFQQGTDAASESIFKLKEDIDTSRGVAQETSVVLQQLQNNALHLVHNLDAAHLELWQSVSGHANSVSVTLQNFNTDIPNLEQMLRSMKTQIDENNEMLAVQQNMVKTLLLSVGASTYLAIIIFVLSLLVANMYCPKVVTAFGFLTCGLALLFMITQYCHAVLATVGLGQLIPRPTYPSLPQWKDILSSTYGRPVAFALILCLCGAILFHIARSYSALRSNRQGQGLLLGTTERCKHQWRVERRISVGNLCKLLKRDRSVHTKLPSIDELNETTKPQEVSRMSEPQFEHAEASPKHHTWTQDRTMSSNDIEFERQTASVRPRSNTARFIETLSSTPPKIDRFSRARSVAC